MRLNHLDWPVAIFTPSLSAFALFVWPSHLLRRHHGGAISVGSLAIFALIPVDLGRRLYHFVAYADSFRPWHLPLCDSEVVFVRVDLGLDSEGGDWPGVRRHREQQG